MPTPKLEVCVDTLAGLKAALAGGADRIELCSALSLGGLSPSIAFMEAAAHLSTVPVHVLLRPRAGDFCYDAGELALVEREIDLVRGAGLAGIVIGANVADGRLDVAALARLMLRADGLQATLHRAVDLAPDAVEAVRQATELGFTRILTSGGAPTAFEGRDGLAQMADAAGGQIGIMPGGGVRIENAAPFLSIKGISELHASCATSRECVDARLQAFGFVSGAERATDADLVRALKARMVESVSDPRPATKG